MNEAGRIPAREEIYNALVEKQGAELTERLMHATVAVCGLGGLGSNIAVMLARAGVGKLILVDFDRVNVTNLHRQQYKAVQVGEYKTDALAENLREIAPYTDLEIHTERIGDGNCERLLKTADIVCEAFDNAGAKAMLTNAVLETMPEKYLVAASGMAGTGSANAVRTRRLTAHFYLCGDGVSDVDEGLPLVPSRVALCAAHQAHMVIRLLAGETET